MKRVSQCIDLILLHKKRGNDDILSVNEGIPTQDETHRDVTHVSNTSLHGLQESKDLRALRPKFQIKLIMYIKKRLLRSRCVQNPSSKFTDNFFRCRCM